MKPTRSDFEAAVRGVDGYARTVLLLTGKREQASYVAVGELRATVADATSTSCTCSGCPAFRIASHHDAHRAAVESHRVAGRAYCQTQMAALSRCRRPARWPSTRSRAIRARRLSRATVVDYVAGKSGSCRTTDGEEKKEEEEEESQTADDFGEFFATLDRNYEPVTVATARRSTDSSRPATRDVTRCSCGAARVAARRREFGDAGRLGARPRSWTRASARANGSTRPSRSVPRDERHRVRPRRSQPMPPGQ